jgi:hypothetical protein
VKRQTVFVNPPEGRTGITRRQAGKGSDLQRDQRVKRQTVFVNHLKGAQQQQRDKQGMEYGRLQWCVFACLCECGCGFVCICVPVCLCVRQQTDSII